VISEKQGRPIYKHIAILDLNGLGRKHVSSDFYQPMKKMIDIGIIPLCSFKMAGKRLLVHRFIVFEFRSILLPRVVAEVVHYQRAILVQDGLGGHQALVAPHHA
jgi:hypothetical protein